MTLYSGCYPRLLAVQEHVVAGVLIETPIFVLCRYSKTYDQSIGPAFA